MKTKTSIRSIHCSNGIDNIPQLCNECLNFVMRLLISYKCNSNFKRMGRVEGDVTVHVKMCYYRCHF